MTQTSKLRYEIMSHFNKPFSSFEEYDKLKACLSLNEEMYSDIQELDEWFNQVISSLLYRPGNNILILVGKQGIGKTHFVNNLLPSNEWICSNVERFFNIKKDYVYHSLISDFTDSNPKAVKYVMRNDGFVINKDRIVDKRLTNAVVTCNTLNPSFNLNKKTIIIYLNSIDWQIFNSINKSELWSCALYKFLTKYNHPFPMLEYELKDFYGIRTSEK